MKFEFLDEITEWLNEEFNQHTDKHPPKDVYRFDEHTAISFWGMWSYRMF